MQAPVPLFHSLLFRTFLFHSLTLQEDDSGNDSDLSDPGEYEKYGPSNSDDESGLDELGNPLPEKSSALPKGIDTAGAVCVCVCVFVCVC
jgi:hypothetical protein